MVLTVTADLVVHDLSGTSELLLLRFLLCANGERLTAAKCLRNVRQIASTATKRLLVPWRQTRRRCRG